MTIRTFAIVYETGTNDIRRLIDTSGDGDDSHLEIVKKILASDETMEVFLQADFPIKLPRFVRPQIGKGVVIKGPTLNNPVDASKIVSIAADVFDPLTTEVQAPEQIDDPIEMQAVAAIRPLIVGLSHKFKGDLAARVKQLFLTDPFVPPRFDVQTRQLLAAEMPPSIANKLLGDAPEAPFYVRAVVLALSSEIYPANAGLRR